jgi:hypothetical protein
MPTGFETAIADPEAEREVVGKSRPTPIQRLRRK